MVKSLTICLSLLLAGCSGLGGPPPPPGTTIGALQAQLGRPTAIYRLPAGQELEYATGPMGQRTWMARFDADGRLVSYEQVLTAEKFATLKVDSATREDALLTFGRPAETSFLPLPQLEVWSYRYKENDVWNSMMHLHFDRAGVLRKMMNGPDPMYEERRIFTRASP